MKQVIIAILLLAVSSTAYSQWECPSRLGAALKPIGNSNFMWGAEVEASGGWVKDNYAGNLMGFFGLNYGQGRSNFYVEGGLKAWMRGSNQTWDYVDETTSTSGTKKDRTHNVLPGLREAFYRYNGDKSILTLGLQSAHGDEDYLLNERVVGLNYLFRTSNWRLNLIGGSVMQDFARNGRFCTKGYLYNDIVVGRPRSYVGKDFGDTNFGMFSVAFTPQKKADEFGEATPSLFSLNKVGAVAYSEFGKQLSKPIFTTGLYTDFDFAGIEVKPEVLMQTVDNKKAVIYHVSAEKKFQWSPSQVSRIYGLFVGYSAIDNGARPINSFSNLFLGDVLRQDVLESPAILLALKHSFTKIKTSIKIQGVMQLKSSVVSNESTDFVPDYYNSPLNKMQELDIAVSKNFGKYVWLNASFGMLNYPNLSLTNVTLHYNNVQTMFGKLDCRITF